MKVSDYVASVLAREGVGHAFVVQGGAVAHLIDSIAKRDDIDYVCSGHEQAAAIAVHGYAAKKNGFGCAIATTGPGIINLINGAACLYYDSLPSIFLGGQVATARYKAHELGVRQLGFQESPHADMMRPVCKYSTTVTDKNRIRYELEKAIHISKAGRPGPVFLDICDDVQRELIDPDTLEGFTPEAPVVKTAEIDASVQKLLDMVQAAKRPVFVLGGGVRIGGYSEAIVKFAERLGIPCMLTWGALDCMPATHPLNAGGFGLHSGRAGNFTVQNADLLVGFGARFTQHQTGTPASQFARDARKVVIDVDQTELDKLKAIGITADLPVCSELGVFLTAMSRRENDFPSTDFSAWRERIVDWNKRYPPGQDLSADKSSTRMSPYTALSAISEVAGEGDYIFGDVGATLSWMYQTWKAKRGQSLLTSFNNHAMGYALPAAIGAALANPGQQCWSINGDGGFLMNIQELGVVAHHNLPVKVIVLNNHGYGVIQQTQEDYFDSRFHASTAALGLMDVDFIKIAEGFGMKTLRIDSVDQLKSGLAKVAAEPGPMFCHIEIDPKARIRPAVGGGRPIEDTAPLLPRDEFRANMIVEPVK